MTIASWTDLHRSLQTASAQEPLLEAARDLLMPRQGDLDLADQTPARLLTEFNAAAQFLRAHLPKAQMTLKWDPTQAVWQAYLDDPSSGQAGYGCATEPAAAQVFAVICALAGREDICTA